MGVEEHGGKEAWRHGRMKIWPNPASSEIHVRLNMDDGRFNKDLALVIYDVFGRDVQRIKVVDGQDEVIVNAESYPSGVYIAILKNGLNILEIRKFVVAR